MLELLHFILRGGVYYYYFVIVVIFCFTNKTLLEKQISRGVKRAPNSEKNRYVSWVSIK